MWKILFSLFFIAATAATLPTSSTNETNLGQFCEKLVKTLAVPHPADKDYKKLQDQDPCEKNWRWFTLVFNLFLVVAVTAVNITWIHYECEKSRRLLAPSADAREQFLN